MSVDGVLVVDKPTGPTSHDVVARVRRVLGVGRVGHTGTLDPLAQGVLPLVVGRATRLARFYSDLDKSYEAGLILGRTTDTYDAAGRPTGEAAPGGPALPGRDQVERALDAFRGSFLQTPPSFSAKKVAGVRAYRLARQGLQPELAPVQVTVSRLEILAFEPPHVTLSLDCSAGFYVRSLAHDLGTRLGCGARLETLVRTAGGGFRLAEAHPLERLEREGAAAAAHLVPLDRLLPWMRGAVLTEAGARRAAHGNRLSPTDVQERPAAPPGEPLRLLDPAGALLGIAEAGPEPGSLRPVVVLV